MSKPFQMGDKIIYQGGRYTIVGVNNHITLGGKHVKYFILINWATTEHHKVDTDKEFIHAENISNI